MSNVEQLQPRELERLRDREEAEVDLDVRAEEELEDAGDVEDRERVAVVREHVRDELVDPDLAVAVEVGEVEEDVGADPALDADGDDGERERCADGDLARAASPPARSAPVDGSRALMKKPLSRLAAFFVAMKCGEPGVS